MASACSGARIGELCALAWADIDEPRSRFRVSRAVAKTCCGRFVAVAPVMFEAVLEVARAMTGCPDYQVCVN